MCGTRSARKNITEKTEKKLWMNNLYLAALQGKNKHICTNTHTQDGWKTNEFTSHKTAPLTKRSEKLSPESHSIVYHAVITVHCVCVRSVVCSVEVCDWVHCDWHRFHSKRKKLKRRIVCIGRLLYTFLSIQFIARARYSVIHQIKKWKKSTKNNAQEELALKKAKMNSRITHNTQTINDSFSFGFNFFVYLFAFILLPRFRLCR